MNNKELLKQLQNLDFIELVSFYIEAKTGQSSGAQNLLPGATVQKLDEIIDTIEECIALWVDAQRYDPK